QPRLRPFNPHRRLHHRHRQTRRPQAGHPHADLEARHRHTRPRHLHAGTLTTYAVILSEGEGPLHLCRCPSFWSARCVPESPHLFCKFVCHPPKGICVCPCPIILECALCSPEIPAF